MGGGWILTILNLLGMGGGRGSGRPVSSTVVTTDRVQATVTGAGRVQATITTRAG